MSLRNNEMWKNKMLKNVLLSSYPYCCIDAPFSNGITLRFQVFVAAVLNRILSMKMNNVGTLFCLFMCMSANIHQGFNHPFESIHFVIPDNQVAGIFGKRQHIRFFEDVSLYIVFDREHQVTKVKKN
jgi:hypothetical protein